MTDLADYASEVTERQTAAQIDRLRRLSHHRTMLPKGCCYFCDAGTTAAQLFCDSDCSEMWEQQKRGSHIVVD